MKKVEQKRPDLLKKDKPFAMSGEIKVDHRGREFMFDVQHNGVTVEYTPNISEALGAHKASMGSIMYKINTASGSKTRYA